MRKASLNSRDESDASKQACVIRAERGRAFILSAIAGGQSVAKAANTVKTNQLGRDGTNTYSTGESASTRFSRVLTVVEELKQGTSSSALPSSSNMTGLVPTEVGNLLQESLDNTSEQFVRHSLDEVWQIRQE